MAKKNKVFVIGGGVDFRNMFEGEGWEITKTFLNADLIQFTGGSDVSPSFYGEIEHFQTKSNLLRDKREQMLFNLSLKYYLPMAGICRGGQFLNIMNGGKMWQHVDGHSGVGSHKVVDLVTGEAFLATSTHHQMMIAHKTGDILAIAKESTQKERISKDGTVRTYVFKKEQTQDIEVLYYRKSNSLCFQPHPEFRGFKDLTNRYFIYIRQYLRLK